MGRLDGKIAIITGAAGHLPSPTPSNNSGIGLESSILFAKEGAKVLMADINPEALQQALVRAKEIVPEGSLAGLTCDVSKEREVKTMVAEAENVFGGGVNVMFNNAGIMHPDDDNALNTEEKIWFGH
jgi:NAD(P)-dependent dehydrogenase (short-subunit alcohol dehydrogenase family)